MNRLSLQRKKDNYDTIIIGAGIGGLVCGCYLAKAGMKVLIIEKNDRPGGYCTSFSKDGFNFDACAHSLGSYRKNGILRKILEDLGINKRIEIIRYDPSDVVVTPHYRIAIKNNLSETVQEFQRAFPHQAKQVENFFSYINTSEFRSSFVSLRDKNFSILLNKYFTDYKLKAIFSLLLLGNIGLPPSLTSASVASAIFREYILDGGYYPKEGMQALPDILATKFRELGGEILLSNLVEKIVFKSNKIKGVSTDKNQFISAKYIVSDCDARHTFLNLLSDCSLKKDIITQTKIKDLEPSLSAFLVYLGVDRKFEEISKNIHNLWVLPTYNIEDIYFSLMDGKIDSEDSFSSVFLRSSNNQETAKKGISICLVINAPFKTNRYWDRNKSIWSDIMIKRIENVLPNFSNYVLIKDTATPCTLQKWALNYKGSIYGWASLPTQFARFGLSQKTFIPGLYLTGHWATLGHGIAMVAFLGYDTAKLILKKK